MLVFNKLLKSRGCSFIKLIPTQIELLGLHYILIFQNWLRLLGVRVDMNSKQLLLTIALLLWKIDSCQESMRGEESFQYCHALRASYIWKEFSEILTVGNNDFLILSYLQCKISLENVVCLIFSDVIFILLCTF